MLRSLVAVTLVSWSLGGAAMCEAQAASRPVNAGAQALLPVALPDLSRLHPSVQQQLNEAHASLLEVLRRADASPAARGDAFGRMGMLFMATRFFEEADRCFRSAQQLTSQDYRWPYYLAHVLKNIGELPAAAESFERARQLRGPDLATLVWLGRVYLDLGRPAEAEGRLSEALSLHPNQPAVRFELGRAALAKRDYRRAVEQLTAALELAPDATAVHYQLAMAYRGLGDSDKAAVHFEHRESRGSRRPTAGSPIRLPDPLLSALSGIVQTPQLYRERGLDAAALGNWPEAVKNFRLVVEAEPRYAAMRVNLGSALERVGDPRGALEQYEEALRLDPRLPEAHYGVADLLERGGREQQAIEHYTTAAMENPNFTAAHLRLADALRRTDRLEQSLEHYRQVIALEPADADARFGEAMALVRLERYVEARDRLTEAMTIHPDQSMFKQALARVLSAAPDERVRDGARAWKLVETLTNEQQHPGVFETVAMVLAELGHFELAVDWQRLAMSATVRAGRADVAQQMAAYLALYQRHQPRRLPWRTDDPDQRPGPRVDPKLLGASGAK